MSDKTNILFPVEILNRELDARLFTAAICANKSNHIFIGQFHAIRRLAGALRGGLYVGQNIFSQPFWDTSFERYNFLKSRELTIIHLDEEGGVYEGDEERWQWRLKRRLDPTKLAAEDHICTWGTFQRDFYQSLVPDCAENIRATGHPRFDVYKQPYREYYREQADHLRAAFGGFVLVNTSWPMVNNARGLKETFSLRRGYDTTDDRKRYDHVSRWTYQTQVLVRFIKLVTHLTIEFPDLNFVIRPHPAEDIQYYKTIFREIPNVHVIHEGSVAPWLFASRGLIQDGCTTGIEAYFADVPIINFKSMESERYDLIVPDSLSAKYSTEEEVAARIREIRAAIEGENVNLPNESLPPVATSMIDNFRHSAFDQLSRVVVEVAAQLPKAESPFQATKYSAAARVQRGYQRSKERFRSGVGRHRPGKIREFPGFESGDLEKKFEEIQRILNKNVGFTLHTDEVISVELEA
jgi:surface carbohydrate biosynthesis protein